MARYSYVSLWTVYGDDTFKLWKDYKQQPQTINLQAILICYFCAVDYEVKRST